MGDEQDEKNKNRKKGKCGIQPGSQEETERGHKRA
jgi:hypothetical protein